MSKRRKHFVPRFLHCDFYTPTKVAYPTPDAAYAAKERGEREHGKPLRVYQCPHGHHYHLTHIV